MEVTLLACLRLCSSTCPCVFVSSSSCHRRHRPLIACSSPLSPELCPLGQKYLKNMCTDYDKTWWMSWVVDKNKAIRFWFRSGYRSILSVGYKTLTVQPGRGMRSTEGHSSLLFLSNWIDVCPVPVCVRHSFVQNCWRELNRQSRSQCFEIKSFF